MNKFFSLEAHDTTMKREILAGLIGYFTIVYIVIVNALILSDAGMPLDAAVMATIVTSGVSCIMMGIMSNSPIIIVPGMGINALFTYTLVHSMGLSWQEALAAVFVAGLFFTILTFTKATKIISESIPSSLKAGITIGLGLFLAFIGLESGGIIVRGEQSIVAIGSFSDPTVLATLASLVVTVFVFIRQTPGLFLWTIIAGVVFSFIFGVEMNAADQTTSIASFGDVFMAMSFDAIFTTAFWLAVFAMFMITTFENIGLVVGHAGMLGRPEIVRPALKANGISAMLSGIFGTSPTVATVETAAAITSGGRTGITTIVTGVLFFGTLFFLPVIGYIPSASIAPILIIIGTLMLAHAKDVNWSSFSESFPTALMIFVIPFTFSIADGIAMGFVAYPIIKWIEGKGKEVSRTMYIVSFLFLLAIVAQAIIH
ncbi:NCS2 family permease [Mangrovibacillus cuniculi]|uniref:NCS2 family permease n=1 Tax=Mangrovibacillus cuniculi TaxID=2593652 RepID=A0A7S8CAV4_9BACI|nr:NCS2 family permease [Mangrovibacillus cuniculi]QPC46584.1 NCS2 family permease [Mangrovibacillus cuniculi]